MRDLSFPPVPMFSKAFVWAATNLTNPLWVVSDRAMYGRIF